ncbi:hypothetical protein [Chlamydia suis]|uniref:Uncharacterized protein n=1 Tax=Chlamydia suis TaxID=83559 RepID=A0AAQ0ELW7_9CHLA|nr:hypothetical protein [Chlamydia suis]MEB2680969.1 hypothetical protein [Chlamydia suis]MEB2682161.1 hypothetical protein [Chlamydia suis]MEB2683084.1 hypothetical protein [Chlamydia suis]MEB2683677.1 hypothetical protein [Chlamydia suis]MEB2684899.1 hypothetical protein [Chlamydia suis]
MSFPLTPSLSGGYQLFPNPQPQTPVPSPLKLPFSLTFGPSRDGEYHLFKFSPPTNPNPLPLPSLESTDIDENTPEVPPCHRLLSQNLQLNHY